MRLVHAVHAPPTRRGIRRRVRSAYARRGGCPEERFVDWNRSSSPCGRRRGCRPRSIRRQRRSAPVESRPGCRRLRDRYQGRRPRPSSLGRPPTPHHPEGGEPRSQPRRARRRRPLPQSSREPPERHHRCNRSQLGIGPQRQELGRQPVRGRLVETHRAIEVLEALFAEVLQVDVQVLLLVLDERLRGL